MKYNVTFTLWGIRDGQDVRFDVIFPVLASCEENALVIAAGLLRAICPNCLSGCNLCTGGGYDVRDRKVEKV